MKTQYFKVNWKAVNEAIPDNLKELRQAQKELRKKIQKKVDDYYNEQRQIEINNKIADLKFLPIDSDIYYIGGSDKIKFGAKGKKIKDKKKAGLFGWLKKKK